MRIESRLGPLTLVMLLLFAGALSAISQGQDRGIRLGEATTSQWRFGVTVKAPGGAVTGIRAEFAVPMDWPEQSVKEVDRQKSANVDAITFKTLDGGVKQMTVAISRLAAGDEATAVVTLEIAKRPILAPDETSVYQIPKPSPALAKFLSPSPYIESRDPKIKALAAELTAGSEPAWNKVAAIFDWVRANVKYEFADQIKSATDALKDGQGDCEELSSLVIAICRAAKIPARAVWVPDHTYPEFYLVDDQGKGHWFPCQAAGAQRQFGSMQENKPILQKGDNFTVRGERTPQRYFKQSLTAKDAAAPPEVKFILERVKK